MTDSLQKFARKFEQQFETPHTLPLCFAHCHFTVKTNSTAVHDRLREYFKYFPGDSQTSGVIIHVVETETLNVTCDVTPQPLAPGKTKVKNEFVNFIDGRLIRKRLTGMTFLMGNETHYALGPCLRNLNQVVNFINNVFIANKYEQGYCIAHAAGVTRNGRGIAFAGFSGSGKSTLALHMLRKNLDYVSNDRLLIRKHKNELEMLGVAKYPRVNPGTLLNNSYLRHLLSSEEQDFYEKLPPEKLWHSEKKFDIPIEHYYSNTRFVLKTSLTAMVILNWSFGPGTMDVSKTNFTQRPDLLDPILKSVGLINYSGIPLPPPERESYRTVLIDTPVYEFSGAVDFEHAVDICSTCINDSL